MRGQAGNTLKLRAAAIRFLHRAAGLPSPTDTAEVSETMAGIRRDAPNPQKKRAATLDRPARTAGADPGRCSRVARPRAAAGRLRRRAAPLGARRHPARRPRTHRPGLRADPEAQQGVADRRGAGPPALRRDRALPGARAGALARRRRDHRRAGVPAHLVAAPGRAGRPPSPAPRSAPSR